MGKTFKDQRRFQFKNGLREFKNSVRNGTFSRLDTRENAERIDDIEERYKGWTGMREGHGKYGDNVRDHFLHVKRNGYNDEIE